MGDVARTGTGTSAGDPVAELQALREVVAGPLADIARRFSRLLSDRWPHRALVIYTLECTGRPRKVAGERDIVERVTIAELEALKASVALGEHMVGHARLAGAQRWVWAVRDREDTLLVLFPRRRTEPAGPSALAAVFGLVATSIRQQVAQASPDYLAESRAASSERTRATAELTAAHEAALTGILSTLRSARLDDQGARSAAADAASKALVALRARRDADRNLSEEAPEAAFQRLRQEVDPLLRHREVAAEFVPPDDGGGPLPGEVAYGARALTHDIAVALTAQSDVERLRVAWECDSATLVVDVRDQSGGVLDATGLRRTLEGRAHTLDAGLEVESVPGWGNRVAVRLPLAPPAPQAEQKLPADLNRREREVLALVAAGKRNRAIAQELGVAESTVKFHISAVLKKLGVATRGEAAVLGLRAGIAAAPPR
ncbi:LuxR C-terminal-related transcriptional regulator [Nocardiopsis sp. RSe5-2]|uniref:LuxR C-terminal-related transcriptional regulator n=1 Tax=Nocardiopsis endophytica TaxID=3018445 RepID=A0ABT4UDY8_9ACTN|nr:LuxR C-terminal-related transcriptional regulator [Nocardiopsis endophytica]MDA2814684.1 LuxR C-terminal-related transcriptional regulator [Nocardiopsis endophytica]